MDIAALLIALVTLAAGIAVGWVLARNRSASAAASLQATVAATAAERAGAVAERDRLRADNESAAAAIRDAESRLAGATAKLEALEQNEARLKDTFARISTEALQSNRKQFLDLADDRFKQAGAPLTDTLGKVERQLGEIEKARAGAQQALAQQIEFVRTTGEALRTETASLVSALRKPQARGRWGELQLRRCIELAGMTDRCDFYEQTTVSTSDGTIRPDVLIRLIGGKTIVVDSKVALSAYLEAYEATDDATRDMRLLAHARHLKHHVNDLASKTYWAQFSAAPEFVVLFVPGDPFLAAALEVDPGLIDEAFSKRVHIATPTTLISTLRTVAYAWQQEALAENAREVFDLGRELYKRLGVFGGHMDKVGRSLTGVVKSYNDAVGSLERKVLVQARRLNELNVVDDDLSPTTPIEEPVRTLAAAELVAAAEDDRAVVVLPAGDELEGRAEDYGIDAATRDESRRTGS
jgi:DNA anti-recombination protein RmuC